MEPEAIFVRLLFRNVPWTPIQAGLARENEKASSKRDIKPPRNEEFVMEMKGITLYTSSPCKQDLPARNGLRGNLSHARNGRGIKFSFPILSPASKKKSYILRGRTPPIYGAAPPGFCTRIQFSYLPSPPPPVKVERSTPALPSVTGRRERTIFVSFNRDKNIVTRSPFFSPPIGIDFFF